MDMFKTDGSTSEYWEYH